MNENRIAFLTNSGAFTSMCAVPVKQTNTSVFCVVALYATLCQQLHFATCER